MMEQMEEGGIVYMNKQSEMNKKAWSYRADEFWIKELGQPREVAKDMLKRPTYHLRRHIEILGDVNGKKIINPLGSCGKKAVPLAVLGADVTVIDISEDNKKYAIEVANEANVNLTYIVSDFLKWDIKKISNEFDIAYLEGGILHYFSNLDEVADRIYRLLKIGGKLILNDFHPFRKLLKERDVFQTSSLEIQGDYFDNDLILGDVSYQRFFSSDEQNEFPKCLFRYWTMGEIISSFAGSGLIIEKLIEGPRFDEHKNIPGEFTLVASKVGRKDI